MASLFGMSLSKAKQKKKQSQKEKPLFSCQPYVSASLVTGNVRDLVGLPPYVDEDEWLAANVFDFFNHLNMFYGTIAEFCTHKDCSTMHAGPNVEYLWSDGQRKNMKVSAPEYVDFVMSWVQKLMDDQNSFPTKAGMEFPKDFSTMVKAICKKLFRVFAHLYHAHFDKILCLNEEGQFNTLFAHFFCFTQEFGLLEKKELVPLSDLITEMTNCGMIK